MAGTLTIATLSDGTNSTSATNCIQGSAKAWVNFGYVSSAITTRASYNVSSVTRTGTGDYTVNFTNAMVDANYVVAGNCQYINTGGQANQNIFLNINDGSGNLSTSSVRVSTKASTTPYDCNVVMVSILR
jgi:hypothetical protein